MPSEHFKLYCIVCVTFYSSSAKNLLFLSAAAALGERCETFDECTVPNSTCIETVCQCFPSYAQVNATCVPSGNDTNSFYIQRTVPNINFLPKTLS